MQTEHTLKPYTFSQIIGAITISALLWWGSALPVVFAEEDSSGGGEQEQLVQEQADAGAQEQSEQSDGDGSDGVAGEEGVGADDDQSAENGESTPAGENGENANTGGEDEEGGDGENVFVETGDAVSTGEAETVANTNVTTTTIGGIDGENDIATESEGEAVVVDDEGEGEEGGPIEVVLDNENDGTADNDMEVTATTGSNGASAVAGGNSAVVSGNAIASANIVNVVNTNIYNSNGFLFLLNNFLGGLSFDFRGLDFFGEHSNAGVLGSPCSLEGCDGGGVNLSITNSSNATINNGVRVFAGTGDNKVSAGGDGSAVAVTGDAYAGANVVNVANTNLVDTNYLLVSFNNFGSWGGDLVLPGASFFQKFFSGSGVQASNVDIQNTNTAEVTNNVEAIAGTGNNVAQSASGQAAVLTGDATSGVNVVNQVNTNLFNSDSFYVLFRVHGNWSGNVFSAPEGIEWSETGDGGVQLWSNGVGGGGGGLPGANLYNTLSVAGSSTAAIANNVSVVALTGDNKAVASAGNAVVSSGNAYAGANVVNVANTNVVGRNWILAIFNIFGDWSGNISFGRPDLWLGVSANTSEAFSPGADVNYTYTVSNRGDADATNVIIKNKFNKGLLAMAGGFDSIFGNSISLGTVRAGETVEITANGKIASGLQYGDNISIPLSATVTANEPDNNLFDNSDEITVVARHIYRDLGAIGAVRPQNTTLDPQWKITKKATPNEVHASPDSKVDYEIVIQNNGGPGYDAVLVDTVIDDTGESVYQQTWDLGTVREDEEITVTYTVVFNENTPPGTYRNEAFVKSLARTPVPQYAVSSRSETVSAEVVVLPAIVVVSKVEEVAEEEVIVEETQCKQYLVEYIKKGKDNNPDEVRKLQTFLVNFGGFLEVETTGVYDTTTVQALKEFQARHKEDVLEPWGLDAPTGYVYHTTRKEINQVYCRGELEFPLSPEAEGEISFYKTLRLAKLPPAVLEQVVVAEDVSDDDSTTELDEKNEVAYSRELIETDIAQITEIEDVTSQSGESSTTALIAGAAKSMAEGVFNHMKNTFKENMRGFFDWMSTHSDYFRGVSGR
jgi:uncharacterized repeat protein (TIGR01451 family)